ncbi:hypothetical protein [Arthrobacter sp. ISL-65]|uniref:hypothetical protein n=1 Tax=Arthrobacter sp. ISL-65 TaxID=2819112 RepID=UPI001BE9DF0F|nr:hypothetical protein [Arthrobacter sp. ISL-65]MBT2547251.1 hypothetical protein [Arthrobacter sp. ISL-65]
MTHLRISLVIDIKADASAIQAAALATPMYTTDEEPDMTAPAEVAQDPVNAGHILALAIQNDLADKIQHGAVTLENVEVQATDE